MDKGKTPDAWEAKTLRKATAHDIPALCVARKRQLADEGLVADAPIDEELSAYFERTMADGSLVEWVAEDNGEVVATAGIVFMPFPPTFANPAGTRGYVTNMYTVPSHRGQGLASKLLRKLLEEARERGVRKLLLCASQMGRPVYRRLGFAERGGWMELEL